MSVMENEEIQREAEKRGIKLIETTAEAARARIAETTEHGLQLLAEAVARAKVLILEGDAGAQETGALLAEAVAKVIEEDAAKKPDD